MGPLFWARPRRRSAIVWLLVNGITSGFVLRPRPDVYSTNFASFRHIFHRSTKPPSFINLCVKLEQLTGTPPHMVRWTLSCTEAVTSVTLKRFFFAGTEKLCKSARNHSYHHRGYQGWPGTSLAITASIWNVSARVGDLSELISPTA